MRQQDKIESDRQYWDACNCQKWINTLKEWNIFIKAPDSKVHGANMGPIWGRQNPDGPHIGPTNFTIWGMSP